MTRAFVCHECGNHITDPRDQFTDRYEVASVKKNERPVSMELDRICRDCIPFRRAVVLNRGDQHFVAALDAVTQAFPGTTVVEVIEESLL